MMRGINHQNIFEDEEDNWQFINTLDRMRIHYDDEGTPSGSNCTYYAYCLMLNHLLLLIREREVETVNVTYSSAFQSLGDEADGAERIEDQRHFAQTTEKIDRCRTWADTKNVMLLTCPCGSLDSQIFCAVWLTAEQTIKYQRFQSTLILWCR